MERTNGNSTSLGRFLLTLAAFVVVVAGLRAAKPIVIPFLLAAFIAVICAPPLFWMQRRKVPTIIAVLIILIGLILVGAFLSVFVGTSVNEFLQNVPVYQERLQGQTAVLLEWNQRIGLDISERYLKTSFNAGTAMRLVGTLLSNLTSLMTNAFMILLTVVFILFEAASFPAKLRAAIGDPEASLSGYRRFMESVNRYLAIKTLISLGTGITATILLMILDIDFPVLWGILAFLLNFIPNIGSVIAGVPPVLLGLVQYGPGTALMVALGYLAINSLFGNILEPRIMGEGLGLSTLIVFVSLVFWGWVLGPVGMLLSMPLTMIVKIALESQEDTRWLAIFLGKPPHTAPAEES
jgi:predicted PurR-regulated permease PerM